MKLSKSYSDSRLSRLPVAPSRSGGEAGLLGLGRSRVPRFLSGSGAPHAGASGRTAPLRSAPRPRRRRGPTSQAGLRDANCPESLKPFIPGEPPSGARPRVAPRPSRHFPASARRAERLVKERPAPRPTPILEISALGYCGNHWGGINRAGRRPNLRGSPLSCFGWVWGFFGAGAGRH